MTSEIKKFEIRLEHDIDEQYQYEPGEVLRGDIYLSNSAEIPVKCIQVQIKGEATVSWDEDNGGQFSASETYVDTTLDVLGDPIYSDDRVESVPRGNHTFPIEFILPPNLPSSFIGKYGSITYVARATLKQDRHLGLGTTITSEPFLVLRRLDIQRNPDLQTKKMAVVNQRVAGSFCFCLFGKIEANFTVNKGGHLPGDDIIIDAEIKNGGANPIKCVQALLVLNSSFHARKKTRAHSQVVNKKTDNNAIEYDDQRRWSGVRLSVPPYIPESRLDGCDMIDIEYELQFRVEVMGSAEIRAVVPITIGTPNDERRDNARKQWNPDNYTVDGGGMGLEESGQISGGLDVDMDINMHEDMMEKFRHPMAHGEVRQNILYEAMNADQDDN